MDGIIIVVFLIIIIFIPVFLFNDNDKETEKNNERNIGYSLATIVFYILEQNDSLWRTLEEKKEVLCFLIHNTNLIINVKFSGNSERIFNIQSSFLIAISMQKNTSLCSLALRDLKSRVELYNKCSLFSSQEGFPAPGTTSLILSHFLKIAKGNVAEKDVTNILLGKAQIRKKDLDQFLEPSESFSLILTLAPMLMAIKKFLDERCIKLNIS